MEERYKHFSVVGLDGRIQSELNYITGIDVYNRIANTNNNRMIRHLKSKASWELAHASETALKSFLIYTDLIRMPYFTKTEEVREISHYNKNNQPVLSNYPKMDGGESSIWRMLLDGRRNELSIQEQSKYTDPKFGMIGNPSALLQEIKIYSLEGDFRKDVGYIENNPIHAYDTKRNISGHDLFAYLKLQSPETQVIINNELFLLGDKISKEDKVIGVLLGYGQDVNQNTESQNSIFINSLTFPKRRFDWITGEEIEDSALDTIKDFATINTNIARQKFPDQELFEKIIKIDYSCFKNTIFDLLDPVGKYYSLEYFGSDEINVINDIAKINNMSKSDSLSFVTMCLHYKRYIKEEIKDNSNGLNFDMKKASNLCMHTNQMKKYDADGNSKLEDSESFIIHLGEIKKIKAGIVHSNDINSYIDMINSSNTEILSTENKETTEAKQIRQFWELNQESILLTLYHDKKYKNNPDYETARKIISKLVISDTCFTPTERIKTFIEMLNSGNTEILKPNNKETFKDHPKLAIGNFWIENRKKIMREFFGNEKYRYNPDYETARKIMIESELDNQTTKINYIIEMLNSGNTEIFNTENDENVEENPEIKQIKHYWKKNQEIIIRILFENDFYKNNPDYETARRIAAEYCNQDNNGLKI